MTNSKSVFKTIVKAGIIIAYIGLIVVLCLQALTPGKESSQISNSVGDTINDVASGLAKPEAEEIKVSDVEISSATVSGETYMDDEFSIPLGSSGRINSDVTPADATNKALKYSSSDTDIIYVSDDGRIVAKGVGIATLYITSDENESISDYVIITVVEIAVAGIEINNLPEGLEVGDKHRLELDFSPSNTSQKSVVWQSSDASVLTVDNSGVITAKAEGIATVTATSAVNGEIVAAAEIEVLPKTEIPTIPVESISISATDNVGRAGGSMKLNATIGPDGAEGSLIWQSSDESVASVSQKGVVSFYKTGEVTITARHGDVADSITLIVKEKLSDHITLDMSGLSENEGGYILKQGKSGKVIARLDEDATVLNIKYSSSDESIAKISQDGSIEALRGGRVTITVSSSYEDEIVSESFVLTVDPLTLKDTMENFYYTIRKSIGHFGAFLVLGIFGALTYYIAFPKSFKGKLLSVIVCIIAGFAVAGITEIFQLPYFTEGRYCSFDDVLLDFAGYCTSAIPIGLIILICHPFSLAFRGKNAK